MYEITHEHAPDDVRPNQARLDSRSARLGFGALVLGLGGFVPALIPIAILFAVVALVRTVRLPATAPGYTGPGLPPPVRKAPVVVAAVVALVASSVWGAVWLGGAAGPADAPCAEPQAGHVTLCTIKPGDCVLQPAPSVPAKSFELRDCAQPHHAQAVGGYRLDSERWPGTAELRASSEAACGPILARQVDAAGLTEEDRLGFLVGDEPAWQAGHRVVICTVARENATKTRSVLRPGADLSLPTGS